ncbi:hypothetical protein Tco_1238243 [Tanacetum coccineum]
MDDVPMPDLRDVMVYLASAGEELCRGVVFRGWLCIVTRGECSVDKRDFVTLTWRGGASESARDLAKLSNGLTKESTREAIVEDRAWSPSKAHSVRDKECVTDYTHSTRVVKRVYHAARRVWSEETERRERRYSLRAVLDDGAREVRSRIDSVHASESTRQRGREDGMQCESLDTVLDETRADDWELVLLTEWSFELLGGQVEGGDGSLEGMADRWSREWYTVCGTGGSGHGIVMYIYGEGVSETTERQCKEECVNMALRVERAGYEGGHVCAEWHEVCDVSSDRNYNSTSADVSYGVEYTEVGYRANGTVYRQYIRAYERSRGSKVLRVAHCIGFGNTGEVSCGEWSIVEEAERLRGLGESTVQGLVRWGQVRRDERERAQDDGVRDAGGGVRDCGSDGVDVFGSDESLFDFEELHERGHYRRGGGDEIEGMRSLLQRYRDSLKCGLSHASLSVYGSSSLTTSSILVMCKMSLESRVVFVQCPVLLASHPVGKRARAARERRESRELRSSAIGMKVIDRGSLLPIRSFQARDMSRQTVRESLDMISCVNTTLTYQSSESRRPRRRIGDLSVKPLDFVNREESENITSGGAKNEKSTDVKWDRVFGLLPELDSKVENGH